MGFTKLDERIVQSSIMAESSDTFKVFIVLLATCQANGISYSSAVYLSAVCRLSMEVVDLALLILQKPDPHSRSPEEDGRRIKKVDGGWEIINYPKYREASIQDIEAERKRLYRARCPGRSGTVQGPSASASESINTSKSTNTNIIDKWNIFADQYRLAKIVDIDKGSARETHLRKLMEKKGFDFDILLDRLSKSPFLLGQTDKRFFATFDWIINKTNYQKIIEGNYIDREPAQRERKFDKFMREQNDK